MLVDLTSIVMADDDPIEVEASRFEPLSPDELVELPVIDSEVVFVSELPSQSERSCPVV